MVKKYQKNIPYTDPENTSPSTMRKASFADDRLNTYQTSSPYRDYTILARIHINNRHKKELAMHRIFEDNAEARRGEWFKISKTDAVLLFLQESKEDDR